MPRLFLLLAFLTLAYILSPAPPAEAAVELIPVKTINTKDTPVDTAIAPNGQTFFVLTKEGELQMYSPTGDLQNTLKVDKDFDGIEVAPNGDMIFLTNREKKSIQIITLDYLAAIDLAGSPTKGPANAPVVIAIFSDFQ